MPIGHIGGHQAGPLEAKSEAFEALSTDTTFVCQRPSRSTNMAPATHGHIVNGKMRRIDYVGVLQTWSTTNCDAWINTVIDPPLRRQTTSLRVLTFRFRAYCHLPARSEASKLRIPRRLTSACYCKAMLLTFKRLDVHTHAAELPKTIVSALLPQCAKLPPHPKKQTTSDRTWQIVLQKREARKLLLLS